MATTTERRDGGVDVQARAQARGCPAPVMPRPRRLTSAEREVLRAARVYAAVLDSTPLHTLRAGHLLRVAASQVSP